MLILETPRARAKAIAATAARLHGVRPEEVFGRSRSKRCVQARAQVAKELRYGMGWTYPHIGRFLQRDHTSVMSMLGRLAKNVKRRRRRSMTIPTVPIARADLVAVSPDYADAVKALRRIATDIGFGDAYDAAYDKVREEALKAEIVRLRHARAAATC